MPFTARKPLPPPAHPDNDWQTSPSRRAARARPLPADPPAAFAAAMRRAQRLVDDPAGAVWYGARRIFAFALMIRDGIPTEQVEPHLHARAWLTDAARLLARTPEDLAAELVDTMLRSGAIIHRNGKLSAVAEYAPVLATALRVPFPRAWPTPTQASE